MDIFHEQKQDSYAKTKFYSLFIEQEVKKDVLHNFSADSLDKKLYTSHDMKLETHMVSPILIKWMCGKPEIFIRTYILTRV